MIKKEVGNPEIVLKNKTTMNYFDFIYSTVATMFYRLYVMLNCTCYPLIITLNYTIKRSYSHIENPLMFYYERSRVEVCLSWLLADEQVSSESVLIFRLRSNTASVMAELKHLSGSL